MLSKTDKVATLEQTVTSLKKELNLKNKSLLEQKTKTRQLDSKVLKLLCTIDDTHNAGRNDFHLHA